MRGAWVIAFAISVLMSGGPSIAENGGRGLLGEWTGTFSCDGVLQSATILFANEAGRRLGGGFRFEDQALRDHRSVALS